MSGFMAFQDLTFLGPKLQITTTNLTLRKYLTIALHFVFTLPEPYFLKKELIFQVRPSKLNYIFLELPILFDMSAKQAFSYTCDFSRLAGLVFPCIHRSTSALSTGL